MAKGLPILGVALTLLYCGVVAYLVVQDAKQKATQLEERAKAVQAYESQIQDLKSQLKAAEYEVDYWRKKACP